LLWRGDRVNGSVQRETKTEGSQILERRRNPRVGRSQIMTGEDWGKEALTGPPFQRGLLFLERGKMGGGDARSRRR